MTTIGNRGPTGPTAATAAGADPRAAEKAKLKQTAEQFEAIFLRQMIANMRQGSLSDDVFGSSATDQFREMADARTAQSMAEKGSFGIADLLLKQFGDRA